MLKILFVTVAVIIFIFFLLALLYAMIIIGRTDEQKKSEETDEMFWKEQICPECKTGQETYDADKYSESCPYIGHLENGKCRFFIPLDPCKNGLLKENNKKVKNSSLII